MNNLRQGETRNIFLLNRQAEVRMNVGLSGEAPAAGRLTRVSFFFLLNLWVLEQSHIQGDAPSLVLLVGTQTGSRRRWQLLDAETKLPL